MEPSNWVAESDYVEQRAAIYRSVISYGQMTIAMCFMANFAMLLVAGFMIITGMIFSPAHMLLYCLQLFLGGMVLGIVSAAVTYICQFCGSACKYTLAKLIAYVSWVLTTASMAALGVGCWEFYKYIKYAFSGITA